MTHIVSIVGLAESVAHIPLGHRLVAREEMNAPVPLDEVRQELLNKLRTESIAAIRLVEGKEINIHTGTRASVEGGDNKPGELLAIPNTVGIRVGPVLPRYIQVFHRNLWKCLLIHLCYCCFVLLTQLLELHWRDFGCH